MLLKKKRVLVMLWGVAPSKPKLLKIGQRAIVDVFCLVLSALLNFEYEGCVAPLSF